MWSHLLAADGIAKTHWNSGDERASCGDTCEGWGEFSALIPQRAEEKTSERLTDPL